MNRRTRHAKTTADRYFYKFISSYIEAKHHDAYKEAITLLERAKTENPGVKDLVKTATFMREAYPEIAIPRYYLNRKLKHQQPDSNNLKEMVLNIPLESYNKPPTTQTVQSVEQHADKQPVEQHAETQAVHPVEPQTVEPALPPLTDDVYMGLLQELQYDPDICSILNDFPMDIPTTPDVLNNDVIVYQDESSPLELELEALLNKTE